MRGLSSRSVDVAPGLHRARHVPHEKELHTTENLHWNEGVKMWERKMLSPLGRGSGVIKSGFGFTALRAAHAVVLPPCSGRVGGPLLAQLKTRGPSLVQADPLLHALGTGVRDEPGRFEHPDARFVRLTLGRRLTGSTRSGTLPEWQRRRKSWPLGSRRAIATNTLPSSISWGSAPWSHRTGPGRSRSTAPSWPSQSTPTRTTSPGGGVRELYLRRCRPSLTRS